MLIFLVSSMLRFIILLMATIGVKSAFALKVENIKKYEIESSLEVKKVLGEHPSVGSSLKFVSQSDGLLDFYGITDRGPNMSFSQEGKHFVIMSKPNFVPSIVKICVDTKANKSYVSEVIPLSYNGQFITGMANKSIKGIFNSKTETALDLNGNELSSHGKLGLDLEGVALASDNGFWVSDEYFPSLNYVDRSGEITKRYNVGRGLPDIMKWRSPNKGIEGIAVTPNGKVYMTLESVLDVDHNTKSSASFIRIIEFSPYTLSTRMFAYPFDQNMYQVTNKKGVKAKIGDIDALNNDELLLIEQGEKQNGGFRNAIFKINIKDAIDITHKKLPTGQDLEHGLFDDIKQYFLPKAKMFEAREFGWIHDKLEGVAIIDNKTIAIINDNDFGYDNYQKIPSSGGHKYHLTAKTAEQQKTKLWVISFDESLVSQ